MSLWNQFNNHKGNEMCKWPWYLPTYEKHFSHLVNKSFLFLEIGVNNGGSLQMWKNYFGPYTKIVGVDINGNCKRFDDGEISVRIGDQSDPNFLQSIIDEFGIPTIVLDDGSHQWSHQIKTFEYLYPKLSTLGIYAVEDTHTSYWKEFSGGYQKSFTEYAKDYIDQINAKTANIDPDGINRGTRSGYQETETGNNTTSISFYDSIIVFEKGQTVYRNPITKN